jgi:hypothetical protein
VDGVSGEPIQGISVTLQLSTYEGFSIRTAVQSRAATDASGDFYLQGAGHPAESPWDEIRAYWITVNEGFEPTGVEQDSAETHILYNPMSNRKGANVADKRYFPLTVSFTKDGCIRVWTAACLNMRSWSNINIPLVPVLDDPKQCGRIGEYDLRERCRQLNTYRAAFTHVDSYEDAKIGKRLCNEVGEGPIAKTCLWQLDLYIANPGYAYVRPFQPQVNEKVPEGMFPDSVADLPRLGNALCGPRLVFEGRVLCYAAYGGKKPTPLVTVSIEEFPEEPQSTNPPTWAPQYTDHTNATVSEETLADEVVLRYRGTQYNSFLWYSGQRHVEVFFYHEIPEQERFVSYYLKKFRSNFQLSKSEPNH